MHSTAKSLQWQSPVCRGCCPGFHISFWIGSNIVEWKDAQSVLSSSSLMVPYHMCFYIFCGLKVIQSNFAHSALCLQTAAKMLGLTVLPGSPLKCDITQAEFPERFLVHTFGKLERVKCVLWVQVYYQHILSEWLLKRVFPQLRSLT